MFATSSSEMSVPMDTCAASFMASSTSGVRMSEKSVSATFARVPMRTTVCAYCRLSETILTISGKCLHGDALGVVARTDSVDMSDDSPAKPLLDSHGVGVDFLVQVI